jgi:hypothetical protein
MTPGTILHDPEFRFKDGEVGNKLLVVLNDGSAGYYVTVRTTSNPKNKSSDPGCHLGDWQPNFFVPKGAACLKADTWVCLDDFYDFDAAELLRGHFAGRIHEIGRLPEAITADLIQCALNSDDISGAQSDVIKTTAP